MSVRMSPPVRGLQGRNVDSSLGAEQHHDSPSSAGRGGAQREGATGTPQGSRDRHLDVRLTGSERAAVDDRARVLGVRASAWARAVMLDALDARSHRVEHLEALRSEQKSVGEVGPAVEQLRRVGINLNQSLRQGLAVDEDLVREVLAEVDALRGALGDRTQL